MSNDYRPFILMIVKTIMHYAFDSASFVSFTMCPISQVLFETILTFKDYLAYRTPGTIEIDTLNWLIEIIHLQLCKLNYRLQNYLV